MLVMIAFALSLISATSVSIVQPVDGETYDGDWLTAHAMVENENEIPDSVSISLNGIPLGEVPRLNTDWSTYMYGGSRNGFSMSPAVDNAAVLWTAPITGDLHEFGAPVVSEGLVFHASDDVDTLYAVNAATGAIVWQYSLSHSVDDGVAVHEGRVYASADSTWCFDAETGEKIWVRGWSNRSSGTPAYYDGMVFNASRLYGNSTIHSMNALTGSDIWEYEIEFPMEASLTAYDGTVYVPLVNESEGTGPLLALDAYTGELEWQSDLNCGFWDTSPCVVDSVIFIGGQDQNLHCIDRNDGQVLWQTNLCQNVESTPAHHDGLVYAGAARLDDPDSTNVTALDATTGEIVWSVGSALHGSVGLAGGLVYWGEWGAANSSVYAADAYTGSIVWEYQIPTGNLGLQSSPAITDGVLYIAGTDSNLYAFGTGMKYTYLDDLYTQIGANELILTSWMDGTPIAADTISFTVTQTGITQVSSTQLILHAAPNPLQGNTTISFTLDEPGMVSLSIFDLAGREVTALTIQQFGSGDHSMNWNGCTDDGQLVSSGLYLCRIEIEGVKETTGLCVLR